MGDFTFPRLLHVTSSINIHEFYKIGNEHEEEELMHRDKIVKELRKWTMPGLLAIAHELYKTDFNTIREYQELAIQLADGASIRENEIRRNADAGDWDDEEQERLIRLQEQTE
jgi:hypothetical protein